MRIRQRDTQYQPFPSNTVTLKRTATSTNTVLPPGYVYYGLTVTLPAIDLGRNTETISDDMGPRGRFKEVLHEKLDYQLYRNDATYHYEYDRTGREDITAGKVSMWHQFPVIPAIGQDRVVISYRRPLQLLLNDAAHALYDSNEANNLLNLLELHQLKSGLIGSTGFIKQIAELVTSASKLPPKVLKSLSKKSLRALANEHLAWSFGYLPLASDLAKTQRGLKALPKILKSLKGGVRVVTKTAKTEGDLTFDFSGLAGYSSTPPSTPNATYWHPFINNGAKPYMVAGVTGRTTRTYQTEGFQALDTVLSKWLSTGPVSLAWELVPFSFVLDWFVDLRPVLDSLDNTFTGSQTSIDYGWFTEKRGYDIQYVKHRATALSTSGNITIHDWPQDGEIIGYTRSQYYRRRVLLDVKPTVTSSNRFGKKQGLLSLALFYQNVANLSSRLRGGLHR